MEDKNKKIPAMASRLTAERATVAAYTFFFAVSCIYLRMLLNVLLAP